MANKDRPKIGDLFDKTEPETKAVAKPAVEGQETKPGTVPNKSRVTMYLSDAIMFALDQFHLEKKQAARANDENMPSKSQLVDDAVLEYLKTHAPHLVDDM